MYNNVLTLDNMRNISMEEIVELYKEGYRLDEPHTLVTPGYIPEYKTSYGGNVSENKVMTLEDMGTMSIDKIVGLYKDGYRLDESLLNTLQYDCSGPMLGAGILGLGLGGLIVVLIIKSKL